MHVVQLMSFETMYIYVGLIGTRTVYFKGNSSVFNDLNTFSWLYLLSSLVTLLFCSFFVRTATNIIKDVI